MPRFWVTWSEMQTCGTEVDADSPQEALDKVRDGDYYFAETYGVEPVYDSYDVEEMS